MKPKFRNIARPNASLSVHRHYGGVRLTTFKWRGTHTVIVSRTESRNCHFMKLALARSCAAMFCWKCPETEWVQQWLSELLYLLSRLSTIYAACAVVIWGIFECVDYLALLCEFFLVFLLSLICSTRLDITTKNGEAKIRCLKISIARCSKPIGLHMLKMRKQVCEIECSFNCSTVGCMLCGIKFDSHPSFWNMRRNNANHFPKIFSAGFQPSYFWH